MNPRPLFIVACVVFAAPSFAQDRVLGLLTLPEVFGHEVCERFKPAAIALHAEPNGAKVGSIDVDQYWSFAAHGGCEGLEVRVHKGTARAELPTREHEYEAPAAIVLGQQGRWFKIRLADGAAWINASARDQFKPLAELFDQNLTAITEHFTGPLRNAPGGTPIGTAVKPDQSVRVLEVRQAGDVQWIHVEALDYSPCTVPAGKEPQAIARGWLPAHSASGEPTVWFFSRGC